MRDGCTCGAWRSRAPSRGQRGGCCGTPSALRRCPVDTPASRSGARGRLDGVIVGRAQILQDLGRGARRPLAASLFDARPGRGQSRTSPLLGSRAQWVAEVHPSKCQSHGPPFMERGWQKSKLPGRLTMHSAVVVRCVSGCGMHRSSGPARRRGRTASECPSRSLDESRAVGR